MNEYKYLMGFVKEWGNTKTTFDHLVSIVKAEYQRKFPKMSDIGALEKAVTYVNEMYRFYGLTLPF
jgi:hypothetical protein